MTEDQAIQIEINELEKQLYDALRALDVKDKKNTDRKKLNDASEKLQLLKKRLSGTTTLFSETYYFIRCGNCGYEAGLITKSHQMKISAEHVVRLQKSYIICPEGQAIRMEGNGSGKALTATTLFY